MNFSDLKMFIRSLLRNKLYTGITVCGFAVSLTFVILLGVYIRQEMSIDNFHANKDRIYRITGEESAHWGALVPGMLKTTFPEVESYTRLYTIGGRYATNIDGEKLDIYSLYVDTAFWSMFSFPMVEGRGFEVKNEVVLSRSFARKMFGDQSPLGKELLLNDKSPYVIVGVTEDFKENTHFDSGDVFFDFTALDAQWISTNNSSTFGVYLLEKTGTDLPSKQAEVKELLKQDFWMYKDNYRKELYFEPLTDVYWSTKWSPGINTNSRMFVSVLMAIVVVILVLAMINYNNLSVARAGFRAKESAVKKLLGSNNRALFRQYIAESVTLCFLAFIVACFLAVAVKPWFNNLLEAHIVFSRYMTVWSVLFALSGVVFIGILAGLLPAWVVTRFNPVEVVKGAFQKKTKSVYSKVLISFQYSMAIILIVCALVMWKQTDFMRNYKLGFDKENVVWLSSKINPEQKSAWENELKRIPGVEMVSYAYGSPLDGGDNNTITNYAGTGKQISFQRFEVDSNFFKVLNLQVIPTGIAYTSDGVWLNEAAAKEIEGGDSPQEIMFFDKKLPVLGIIKDFHIRSLTAKVGPLIVFPLAEGSFWKILIKVDSSHPATTFEEIKKAYSRFINGVPFGSGFMDETINSWYEGNARTAKLIGYFSVLAIVLSMMGILAMATYFIRQRVKEIGIRRVNGAKVSEILRMLLNSFMKWILLSFFIACPVAWYVMNRWLQEFPYRTDFSWWLFAGAGLLAFAVAGLMVGWQSVKAATENPVKSLKSE